MSKYQNVKNTKISKCQNAKKGNITKCQNANYPIPTCIDNRFLWYLARVGGMRLKVSYFFLSIHFGLQGLSKITFWGPWTYLTNNSHCKLRNLVALRGQKSKKKGYLRIQGRMQIFEKKVPEGLKSRFDTLER